MGTSFSSSTPSSESVTKPLSTAVAWSAGVRGGDKTTLPQSRDEAVALVPQPLRVLDRLSGPASIPLDDPSWVQLLSFPARLDKAHPLLLDAVIQHYAELFLAHNGRSRNFNTLLAHISTRLVRARGLLPEDVVGLLNGVLLARGVLRGAVERGEVGVVWEGLCLGPNGARTPQPVDGMDGGSFVVSLLDFCSDVRWVDVAENEALYGLAVGVLDLLLVLLSSQAFQDCVSEDLESKDPFLHALLQAGTSPVPKEWLRESRHGSATAASIATRLGSHPSRAVSTIDALLSLATCPYSAPPALSTTAPVLASTSPPPHPHSTHTPPHPAPTHSTPTPPPSHTPAAPQTSIASLSWAVVDGVGGAAERLAQLPLWLVSFLSTSKPATPNPLAERATLLFLVLVHNLPSDKNPYRAVLSSTQDASYVTEHERPKLTTTTHHSTAEKDTRPEGEGAEGGEAEGGGGGEGGDGGEKEKVKKDLSAPPPSSASAPSSPLHVVSFDRLFAALAESMGRWPSRSATMPLLVYTLLQQCAAFRIFATARADLDAIITPLLSRLAACVGDTQRIVLVVLALFFTQDVGVVEEMHRESRIVDITSYTTSQSPADTPPLSSSTTSPPLHPTPLPTHWVPRDPISLGSLFLLSLTICIRTELARGPHADPFIIQNASAALTNSAPHVRNIHPSAARKLLALATSLARRWARCYHHVTHAATTSTTSSSSSSAVEKGAGEGGGGEGDGEGDGDGRRGEGLGIGLSEHSSLPVEVLVDSLTAVLSIVGAALRPGVAASNLALAYELVHATSTAQARDDALLREQREKVEEVHGEVIALEKEDGEEKVEGDEKVEGGEEDGEGGGGGEEEKGGDEGGETKAEGKEGGRGEVEGEEKKKRRPGHWMFLDPLLQLVTSEMEKEVESEGGSSEESMEKGYDGEIKGAFPWLDLKVGRKLVESDLIPASLLAPLARARVAACFFEHSVHAVATKVAREEMGLGEGDDVSGHVVCLSEDDVWRALKSAVGRWNADIHSASSTPSPPSSTPASTWIPRETEAWFDDAHFATIEFVYEEGDRPQDFFVPLTWKAVVRACPDINWDQDKANLFPDDAMLE